MIIDKLIDSIITLKSPICVGLDTKFEYIPKETLKKKPEEQTFLSYAADCILDYNKALVDAVADIVPSVKVQSAYYEMYGWEGVRAMANTIAYAKAAGLIVIADVKRNDIGATASAYSTAYLGKTAVGNEKVAAFDADFATLNAYLGTDGIKPFVEDCKRYDKGAFILVKTSNPSSGELQDLIVDERKNYEYMAQYVTEWGSELIGKYGYSSIGAVVGATYPEQAEQLRHDFPHMFVLVPGYGAQGGGAKDILANFDTRGLGGIVNNSRAILTAWQKEEYAGLTYAQAARSATLAMQKDILDTFASEGIVY